MASRPKGAPPGADPRGPGRWWGCCGLHGRWVLGRPRSAPSGTGLTRASRLDLASPSRALSGPSPSPGGGQRSRRSKPLEASHVRAPGNPLVFSTTPSPPRLRLRKPALLSRSGSSVLRVPGSGQGAPQPSTGSGTFEGFTCNQPS